MKIEKSTIKTEALFSQDHTHRLLLRKEWDNTKPVASVIMINPHSADTFSTDSTTMYTLNNLYSLGYGAANLLNLYTRICDRLMLRFNSDEDLLDPQNDEIILKCAAESDEIIIAWGSAGHNSQRVRDRQAAAKTSSILSLCISLIGSAATDMTVQFTGTPPLHSYFFGGVL